MKWNVITGFSMVAFSLLTLTLFIPTQISKLSQAVLSMGVSPKVFPQIASAGIGILGLLLAVTNMVALRKHRAQQTGSRVPFIERPKDVGAFFAIVVAYVYLLEVLGHFITTPIAIAAMMYFLGERKIIRLVSTPVATTLLLSLFFRSFLNTVLPTGILY